LTGKVWVRVIGIWYKGIPAHSAARQITDFAPVNRTELYIRARVAELRRQPRLAAG
jgi:hypothetical protein